MVPHNSSVLPESFPRKRESRPSLRQMRAIGANAGWIPARAALGRNDVQWNYRHVHGGLRHNRTTPQHNNIRQIFELNSRRHPTVDDKPTAFLPVRGFCGVAHATRFGPMAKIIWTVQPVHDRYQGFVRVNSTVLSAKPIAPGSLSVKNLLPRKLPRKWPLRTPPTGWV